MEVKNNGELNGFHLRAFSDLIKEVTLTSAKLFYPDRQAGRVRTLNITRTVMISTSPSLCITGTD